MSTRRNFIKATVLTGASLGLTSACLRFQGPVTAPISDALRKFRSSLSGRVILPSDSDYDKTRQVVWRNPETDKRPAMLAQCETDDDVARCIDYARHQELSLAVRSGGHSFMGWGIGDGLVIDVSRMKEITLDAAQGKIRVGAGVTAEEMLSSAAKHGLAPVLGECGTARSSV